MLVAIHIDERKARQCGFLFFRKKLKMRIKKRPYLFFILPALVFFTIFYYFPIVYAGIMSLHRWRIIGTPRFIGLQNYIMLLFESTSFRVTFKNTVFFTFWYVILNLIFALFLALFLNKLTRGLSTVMRVICFLPVVSSMVGMSIAWKWMFEPTLGLVNYILSYVGLGPFGWLKSTDMAMASIIIVSVWKQLGFFTIIFLAGLLAIPIMYYESARIDGASRFRLFWNITLPLLRPIIALQLIITTIWGFRIFTQVFVLTMGGPGEATMTVVMYMYITGIELLMMGKACAAAFVVSICIVSLSILQYHLVSRTYY